MKKITYTFHTSEYWKEDEWRRGLDISHVFSVGKKGENILRTVITDDETAMLIAIKYTVIDVADI